MNIMRVLARIRSAARGAVKWGLDHRGVVLAGAAAVVLVGASLGLWWWWATHREGLAGAALAEANLAFRQQYPAGFYLPGGDATDLKPDALIERYQQLADRFEGTRAGAEALLRAAHLKYSVSQYDAAIKDYERYAAQRYAPFRSMALLGKGYALLAKGDREAAAEAFGRVAEQAPRDPVAAEAYLMRARALEGLKRREEALRVYELIGERFPQSVWALEAAGRVSALR